ncbi:hypothetical protein Gorai_014900, partial [Gossypium raimondii]|nr:hypothetical protein [Gossypium raimondii]
NGNWAQNYKSRQQGHASNKTLKTKPHKLKQPPLPSSPPLSLSHSVHYHPATSSPDSDVMSPNYQLLLTSAVSQTSVSTTTTTTISTIITISIH